MARIGSKIDERGIIVRDGERIIFRRESGGRWALEAVGIDLAQLSRVIKLRGVVVDEGLIAIEAIAPPD